MIRYSLLWLFVFGLMGYAWRDWCKSLCILIGMLAVLERPDMPKTMFGIQGMNPFNIALLGILVAWASTRGQDQSKWDPPQWFRLLFGAYLVLVAVSTIRLLMDPSYLVVFLHQSIPVFTKSGLIAEFCLNTFKWVIPAVLLVDGCRTDERRRWVIVGVLGVYVVLALQVVKQIPPQYLLDGEALQQRAADVLQRRVGYHRVDLATMFAGASWALMAARPLFSSSLIRLGLVGLSGVTALGLASTGGRTGYATFCIIGLILALLRWRVYLLLIPPAIALVLTFAPGIAERMLQGFGTGDMTPVAENVTLGSPEERDEHLITSGRNVVWPHVIERIQQRPAVGFGRQAWVRTNARVDTYLETNELFGHPHNAYLEFTLDNGLIGLAIVVPLFGMVLWNAARMFRDRENPTSAAVGGMALAMAGSFTIAAFGAQTFYPTEGAVGMWCMTAVLVRWAADQKTAKAVQPIIKAPATAGHSGTRSVALWPKEGRLTSRTGAR